MKSSYKEKDRMRKKVKKLSCVANSTLNASVISNSSTSSTSNNSFCTKQAVDKATARAVRALPKGRQVINNTSIKSFTKCEIKGKD